jgi:protein gp37
VGDVSSVEWLHDPYTGRQGGSLNLFWGCERVSPACLNCYIFRQPPLRMRGLVFDKAAIGGKTEIIYAPRTVLLGPLRKTTPKMWFVESLGDLWYGRVPARIAADVYALALLTPHHIYITSTKRVRRQHNWLRSPRFRLLVQAAVEQLAAERVAAGGRFRPGVLEAAREHLAAPGPMREVGNVWVGCTVEDNAIAAERVPLLRDTPAAVRWLSAEPLTSEDTDPINLGPWLATGPGRIHWLVLGGESGPPAKATPLDTEPAVGLRDVSIPNLIRQVQIAQAAGVAVFVKQLGTPWASRVGIASRKGADPAEWPPELRVREYPAALELRARRTQQPAGRSQSLLHR